MESQLKISVVVPCYNQGRFLEECIRSLRQQDYTDWECILVNDGSIDETEEKALAWQKTDERIKYFKKENGGLSSARNYGLRQATGDYIQFLDCDDYLAPQKFSKSIASVNKERPTVVITNFQEFDEKKQTLLPPYCLLKEMYFNQEAILKEWDKSFTIPIHCALFPAKLVEKYQFDEELKAKEDWFFWLQIYENKLTTIFIDEPLVYYRVSSAGMTRNHLFMHENQLTAFRKLDEVISNKNLYLSFLKSNNEFYMNEVFRLKNEVNLLRQKRKLNYKINKVLSFFKLK
ncbi:glycosyltransferase family 2 protein [Pedobacter sp. ASV28]|uniref:glycosyltransferase family 2 protein n=1 Tax=Pedobacter sp. ASV28 TaxID=2795123 RepID=UPI0018EAAA4E|nr:glycosyltransferase family 2 protein [Pedobacter sp. ASV28]